MAEESGREIDHRGYVFLILMVLIGSSTAPAAKYAVQELPIGLLPLIRFGVAGLCLWPLLWRGGVWRRMLRQDGWRLALTAALCVPVNQTFFLNGLKLAPTSHVALIYAACPLVVLLLASTLGQERLVPGRLAGVLASVLGVVVIGLGNLWRDDSAGRGELWGDLLTVGAVISWGAYLTACKPLIARHGALPVLAATFLVGALLDLPVALATLPHWSPLANASGAAWRGLVYLTLVVTVLGLACQNQALRRLDASQVATVGNASPILTVLWGVWLFHETVTPALVVGGALTLGGILWTGRPRIKPLPGSSQAPRFPPTCHPDIPSRRHAPVQKGGGCPPLGRRLSSLTPVAPSRIGVIPRPDARSPMSQRGGLAVYVTSHGFGHLNRAAAVINRMPPEVPVTVRSHPNLFDHWRERLKRPATLEPHVSDLGALSPPGNSLAVDGPATLEAAARVHAEAMARVDDEARRLRDEGTAAVLCDITPVPLVAARRAGVPGFLLANFTWADIYAPHSRTLGDDARRLLAALRDAYRHATALLRAEPALRLTDVAPVIEVGMVVTPGRNRKCELRQRLGLTPADKLVYFYVGRYGQDNLVWERLERLVSRGVHFVGFHPAPTGPLANLHVVPPSEWTGADLAASTEAVVAKAGYGTACEAMVAGTPLIYPPRTGFAEHRALDRALRAWGGGVPASARAFAELRLEALLDRAFALKPGPPPFVADGAARAAERLTQSCASSPNRLRG